MPISLTLESHGQSTRARQIMRRTQKARQPATRRLPPPSAAVQADGALARSLDNVLARKRTAAAGKMRQIRAARAAMRSPGGRGASEEARWRESASLFEKFVHVAPQRFEHVSVAGHGACGLTIGVKGTPGESVRLVCVDADGIAHVAVGAISSGGRADVVM